MGWGGTQLPIWCRAPILRSHYCCWLQACELGWASSPRGKQSSRWPQMLKAWADAQEQTPGILHPSRIRFACRCICVIVVSVWVRDTHGNIYSFQLFCGMSLQSIKFKTADLICYAAVCIYQGISQLSWYHCTESKKCCVACLSARKTSVSDANLLLRSKLCLWYCCLLLMAPYERKASDLDKKHSYLFFPFGFS